MVGRVKIKPRKIKAIVPEPVEAARADSDTEWAVENIVNKRVTKLGRVEYFVKWKDYAENENTWEPADNLQCHDLIKQYEDNLKLASEATKEIKEEILEPVAVIQEKVSPDPSDEYEVEKIIDKKSIRKKVYYFVKWKGFDHCDNTWEPVINLDTCPQLVIDFEKTRQALVVSPEKVAPAPAKTKTPAKVSAKTPAKIQVKTQPKTPTKTPKQPVKTPDRRKKNVPIKVRWKSPQVDNSRKIAPTKAVQPAVTADKTKEIKAKPDICTEEEEIKFTVEDIEKIVDKKVVRGKARYLVVWKEKSKANAWLVKNVLDCNELVAAYEEKSTPKRPERIRKPNMRLAGDMYTTLDYCRTNKIIKKEKIDTPENIVAPKKSTLASTFNKSKPQVSKKIIQESMNKVPKSKARAVTPAKESKKK